MASIFQSVGRWLGWGGALREGAGQQSGLPGRPLTEITRSLDADGALQISAVWACIDRRATVIASLPMFTYDTRGAEKVLARTSRLYQILHDSPNSRMTCFEFWRAMMMSYDLRGNAYARIDRDDAGEALALWPMPADQVRAFVLPDGSMWYEYQIDGRVVLLPADRVLHLKNLGNGTIGLAKLEFMRSTTDEQAKATDNATKIFGNAGKPTGVLMIDTVLKPGQRESLRASYGELASTSTTRLAILEANMKYQQLSISPQDQQLLETRNFGIEEICRWFDVPPVLIHHANVTTWGSGIAEIVDGFHKFTIRPMAINIEQALKKRVMSPRQRATLTSEFSLDALLRGNAKDRAEIAAKKVQNGLATRNEMRQLENEAPLVGGDVLTVQANLLPIELLGKVKPSLSLNTEPVSQ